MNFNGIVIRIVPFLLILALSSAPATVAQSLGEEDQLWVGLVLTSAGRSDAFNDTVWTALFELRNEGLLNFKFAEPARTEGHEYYVNLFVDRGYDLIILIQEPGGDREVLENYARRFPDRRFIYLSPTERIVIEPGRAPEITDPYRGAFLAGIAAGTLSPTGIVGYLGGAFSPTAKQVELSFLQGLKEINPQAKLLPIYLSLGPAGDIDPLKARALSFTLIEHGADVLFEFSGDSGIGVLRAAQERGIPVIYSNYPSVKDPQRLDPELRVGYLGFEGKPMKTFIRQVIEGNYRRTVSLTLWTDVPQVVANVKAFANRLDRGEIELVNLRP
ncbi:MAG: BMP family ABC transporter substrate-binding protein [Candidatus Bipolaricaulia bacterium]